MNRLFAEQLTQHLASSSQLASVYFLLGQDLLLLNESQDQICQTALAQGFDERNSIQIDSSTDWSDIFERCNSMGLFFNKQILQLNLPENLTVPMQKNLLELANVLTPDVLLILQLAKLSKANEKQDWFVRLNQYEPNSLLVTCQTPTVENLPRWLKNRSKTMGLQLDKDASQLLCYSYESNLLALKQALQLLDLLHPDHKLTYQRVKAVVEQSSVFTSFQWVDALLEGKLKRAKRILAGLQAEDLQPIILLRTFQRELMVLLELSRPQKPMKLADSLPVANLRAEFDRLKVWQNRRPLFTAAVQRLTYQRLYQIVQQLAEIERRAKQDFAVDVWNELGDLSAEFCLADK